MKILIISDDHPDIELGGAGRIAFQSAQWLAELGHDVWFIAATSDVARVYSRDAGHLHERIVYIPRARIDIFRAIYSRVGVRVIRKMARDIQYDVVHAHGLHRMWSFAALKAVRPYTRKLIWTAHDAMSVSSTKVHSELRSRGIKNLIRKNVVRHEVGCVDAVIAVSDSLGEYLKSEALHVNIHTLHNSIDVAWWDAIPGEGCGMPDHSVLLSGRLSAAKGVYLTIDAMKRVRLSIPEACLVLVGGPELAARKAMAYASDPKLVRVVGQRDHKQMKCLMRSCAVVVVPSIYLDPFPTVNMEAMALGVPVVGTKFGGTPEIVIDGQTGSIIDPADIDSFANAITSLLSDAALRKRLGEAGRRRIIEYFNSAQYTDALIKIYTQ